MKKKIKFLYLLIIISFPILLLGGEGPKIVFKELTHDMGKIPYNGKPVIYGFRFKNLGTSPLVIKNVRTDCSCISAVYPTEPVMPGESGEITAKFTPGGFTGVFYKSYRVGTNDNENSNVELMLQGNLRLEKGINKSKVEVKTP